ncbi:MAG: hypothetical protein U1E63_07595 [Burkholderiales bacterium]
MRRGLGPPARFDTSPTTRCPMRAHQTLDLSHRQPESRGRLTLAQAPLAHRFDHLADRAPSHSS